MNKFPSQFSAIEYQFENLLVMSLFGFHAEISKHKEAKPMNNLSTPSHIDQMSINEFMKGFDDLTDF